MPEPPEVTKEKSIEQTITILLMRLNQSLAEADSLNKLPGSNKPRSMDLYREVYKDIFELSRLVRASLSIDLLDKLSIWRQSNISLYTNDFIPDAIILTENIYDELSNSGMIDVRVRKTAVFPIDFYLNQLNIEL